jgi:hypothetical protein
LPSARIPCRLSFRSVTRTCGDKDSRAQILAGILGGGPQNRIADACEPEMGITNDVTAAWHAGYAHPGLFDPSGTKAFPLSRD